ncbi:NAP1 [Symbiodinium pilosum]|uniref:NAP1 protein n=1 Tax=Symbiodinium pilosum TaxID=2952 RepID=A0A812JJQ9_SYMPI|nr:NAP1 [Symbiodinium pilosum]
MMSRKHGQIDLTLPASGREFPAGLDERGEPFDKKSGLGNTLFKQAVKYKARSPFSALSGAGDFFLTPSDLSKNCRNVLHLDLNAIPTVACPLTGADASRDLEATNSWILDFMIHGQRKYLWEDNGINATRAWKLIEEFVQILKKAVKAMKAFAPEDDIVLTTMTQLAKVRGQQIADLVLTLSLIAKNWGEPPRTCRELSDPGSVTFNSLDSVAEQPSSEKSLAYLYQIHEKCLILACKTVRLAQAESWSEILQAWMRLRRPATDDVPEKATLVFTSMLASVLRKAAIARGGDSARSDCLIEIADAEQVLPGSHDSAWASKVKVVLQPVMRRFGPVLDVRVPTGEERPIVSIRFANPKGAEAVMVAASQGFLAVGESEVRVCQPLSKEAVWRTFPPARRRPVQQGEPKKKRLRPNERFAPPRMPQVEVEEEDVPPKVEAPPQATPDPKPPTEPQLQHLPPEPPRPSPTSAGDDDTEEDREVAAGEAEVAKAMAALLDQPFSKQKKVLKSIRLQWHPDKCSWHWSGLAETVDQSVSRVPGTLNRRPLPHESSSLCRRTTTGWRIMAWADG